MANVIAIEMTNGNITESDDTHVSKTLKRFELRDDLNGKVFGYRRLLSAKWAKQNKPEPDWVDALEELLDTHPALKKI
jgi:hypothetical protein